MLRSIGICVLASAVFSIGGCSLPSLENPQCAEARDSAKRMYSWYIGTDPKDRSADILNGFLLPGYSPVSTDNRDPVTLASTTPTSFRVGKCVSRSPDQADVEVQLLWHTDEKNVQKDIYIQMAKVGGAWKAKDISTTRPQ